MKIAIVYAMDSEIQSMLALYEKYTVSEHCGVKFYETENGPVLCTVGIGKVNAAFGTTLLCEKYRPNVVISAGVAGSFEHFDQDTILIAEKCAQHDFDTQYIGDQRFFVSTVNKIFFDCAYIDVTVSLAQKDGYKYRTGLIASGDKFMVDNALSRDIKEALSPLACEMEACAVAQVCLRENVDFLAVKTASDCIFSDGQTQQYETNLSQAAENLNGFVIKLAKILKEK